MSTKQKASSQIWTPANIVTMVRILLVPVFVAALISPWPQWMTFWPDAELFKPWVAALIFAILAATDSLDGYLARSRGEVTDFGKFIDPLADKILVCAALLALCELQMVPTWAALIILAREFIVSGLRMLAASQGVVVAASWYGKAKTVFQIIAIFLFIIKGSELLLALHESAGSILYVVSWIFMIIALVLTIVSMLDYFYKCREVLGFEPAETSDEFFISRNDLASEDAPDNISRNEKDEVQLVLNDPEIISLASEVIALATNKDIHISTAESCTGGLIAGSLTAISGSSAVVEGGIVSYSNVVKNNVLGVSQSNLDSFGAVSAPVAEEMALGSLNLCNSDIAVSVTGIAGPGGGTEEKPVGTVWFGVATESSNYSQLCHFGDNRLENRTKTVIHALELFKKELQ